METGDAAVSGVIGKDGPTLELVTTKLSAIKDGVIVVGEGVGDGVITQDDDTCTALPAITDPDPANDPVAL